MKTEAERLRGLLKRIWDGYGRHADIPVECLEEMDAMFEAPPALPYPWCHGNPTIQDCIEAGYCRRDPNCGE